MSNFRSVVYVSSAVRMFSESELEALLVEARELNRETGITGVLLYSGGTFMQCIEGSESAVDVTYERIRNSRKHHGIIELANEPTAQRDFADWQMGYRRVGDSQVLALSTAQWERRHAAEMAPGRAASSGLMLLKNFWARDQR